MYNDKGCTTILVLLLVFIIHQSEEQIHVPEWKMSRARKFWNITYEDYSYHEEQRAFNGNEIYPFPEGSMFSVSITCTGYKVSPDVGQSTWHIFVHTFYKGTVDCPNRSLARAMSIFRITVWVDSPFIFNLIYL